MVHDKNTSFISNLPKPHYNIIFTAKIYKFNTRTIYSVNNFISININI